VQTPRRQFLFIVDYLEDTEGTEILIICIDDNCKFFSARDFAFYINGKVKTISINEKV